MQADIGLIGVGVMGENLVLNMEGKGFAVSVFDASVGKVERFVCGRGQGKKIRACVSIQELVASLALPRKIMLMVPAGKPVDAAQLEAAVYLHDIGMMLLPESVWLKVGPLTDAE